MQMFEFSMEELIPIVAMLSDQYTSRESSSISYAKENNSWKRFYTVSVNLSKQNLTAKRECILLRNIQPKRPISVDMSW